MVMKKVLAKLSCLENKIIYNIQVALTSGQDEQNTSKVNKVIHNMSLTLIKLYLDNLNLKSF